MKQQLFRKSVMDRVNSPEQLNEYMRVAHPSVWLILGAMIALLAGVVLWGVFGTIESTMDVVIVSDENGSVCYVPEADAARLEAGMSVTAENGTFTIEAVSDGVVKIGSGMDDVYYYMSGFQGGDFAYQVRLTGTAGKEGIYRGSIVLESTYPMSFVLK